MKQITILFLIFSFFVSCTTTEIALDKQSEHIDRITYPGPSEATELLKGWENAIRTRDLDLLKEIMVVDPLLYFHQENGLRSDIYGFDPFTAFRLAYFKDLGEPEDYALPPLTEMYEHDIFFVYLFHHREEMIDERIYLVRDRGKWKINHAEINMPRPGAFVTNQFHIIVDEDKDGFINEAEIGELSKMMHRYYDGPHYVENDFDAMLDFDHDGIIKENDIRKAKDFHLIPSFKYLAEIQGELLMNHLDLNTDGTIDDAELNRISDMIIEKKDSANQRSELINTLHWTPIPDAVYQAVPRPVSNYIDELADGNKDGKIDEKEQEIIMHAHKGDHQVENYFERTLDLGRDGFVNWNEILLTHQRSALGYAIIQDVKPPFLVVTPSDSFLDKNQDGFIDQKELDTAVSLLAGNDISLERLTDELINQIDLNEDGNLSISEIERSKGKLLYPRRVDVKEQFERNSDIDIDGYLNEEEIGIFSGYTSSGQIMSFAERIEIMRKQGDSHIIEEELSRSDEASTLIAQNATASERKLREMRNKRVAVVGIEAGAGEINDDSTVILTVFVENALVNLSDAKIIDRKHMEQISEEMNFQLSGMIDENTAVEIGKLLGADIIAIGNINSFGGKYYLNMKLLSVQTAEIVGSSLAEADDMKGFLDMANQVVDRLF